MKQYEYFADLLINPNSSIPIYNCILNINTVKKEINYKITLGKIDTSDKKHS